MKYWNDLHRGPLAGRLALAAALVALALGLRLLVMPLAGGAGFTFYPAVVLAFYLCGSGPGAAAAMASAVLGYTLFMPPQGSLAPTLVKVFPTTTFLLTSALIGWVIGRLQQTERALTESHDRLQHSEQRYLAMLEDQTELIGRCRADGTLLYVNPAYCAMFGVRAEDVIGTGWQPRAVPEDVPRVEAELRRLSAEQPVVTIENRLVLPDGAVRWFEFVNRGIFDREGRLLEIQAVARDTTELHRAREATEAVLRSQQSMLDSDLVGILRVRERRIVWANAALGRIFGYAPDELLGQAARITYFDDESYHALGAAASKAIGATGRFRTQLRKRRKDGSAVWVELNATVFDAASGELLCMVVDIDAQKHAEEVRLQAVRLDAENRQLRETQRLHSRFTANVSHEMRTPLNAIIGLGHLLRSGTVAGDKARLARYADDILASGQSLLAMVERVLDLARLDSGNVEFHPQAVALAPLLERVVATQRERIDAARLAVQVEVAPEAATVELDPLRLEQVLAAYLDNAVAFTPAQGRIAVRARVVVPGWLHLEVEDSGPGIPEADQPSLFQSFRQLDTGSNRRHTGAGLSLAWVRRLVVAQGGEVGVRSRPGEGSLFFADLPLGRAPRHAAPSASSGGRAQPL